MTRLPSLVPVFTGALAGSAGALLLLGWHGRPLAGVFMIAAIALGIVPLLLLFRMAAPGRFSPMIDVRGRKSAMGAAERPRATIDLPVAAAALALR